MDAYPGGLFDDAGADLKQVLPEGCELGLGERHPAGHGIAQGEHQPVGRGIEHQTQLVGDRALAGGPVRGELALVQFDRVLGLAAGAVNIFIEMAGVSAERGDVAGVEAPRACLRPGDDPALAAPGARGVGEGGEAPHPVRAGLGAAHPEVVGDLVCKAVQGAIARHPWAHWPLPRASRRQPRGGRVAPRAGPSLGLRGQAATEPVGQFYVAVDKRG